MTPGFQWVLAGAARLLGLGDVGLRLTAMLFSVAVFGVLGMVIGRRCGTALGALLVAPLMGSMYVTNSAAWVLADNSGWLWVGLLAVLALFARTTMRWVLVVGAGLLLAVWTRQNLLFLAMPLWAAAWLGTQNPASASANPLQHIPARVRGMLPIVIVTIPSLVTIGYLYHIWGGLVPYEFQGQYDGANPSNLALQLIMLAGLGVFFLPVELGVGEPGWRARIAWAARARSRSWRSLRSILKMRRCDRGRW